MQESVCLSPVWKQHGVQHVGVVGCLPVGHHRLAGDAVDVEAAAHGSQDVLQDTQASEKSAQWLEHSPFKGCFGHYEWVTEVINVFT